MIKKVEVIAGCISCRTCESVCPSVFEVSPKSKVISEEYIGKEAEILQAELMCPVQVIKVKKEGNFVLTFKKAQLKEKKYLTSDILELRFITSVFSAQAGQYISLRLKDMYGSFSRSYSLCEYGKDFFTLTVKILPKGRGGKALKKLQIGKEVDFLGGLGNFVLQNTSRPKVCIATGTGLAPMLEILKQTDPSIPKLLIYGVRTESDLYHLEKFSQIKNLEIIVKISQREAKNYSKGRVTDELTRIPNNAEIYLCGNPDMISSVNKELLKVSKEKNWNMYQEGFTLSSDYKGLYDYHIVKGNLPYTDPISRTIIIISLFGIVPAWLYMASQKDLFGSFGPIENFMGFLYDLSWWSVVAVMGIRPLSDIFPKVGILRTLKTFRKSLGVLSASIIVIHWLGPWIFAPEKIGQYFMLAKWGIGFPLIARLSEITAIVLLVTSNTFSQVFLGAWWKRVQRLSYVYFICGGLIAAQTFPEKIYPSMVIVGLLYLVAFLKRR